jgi:uncharacterized protein YceH (UPF0502 family)
MLHFPELQLTFVEARVLGCLLEKETLTPGSYPLTLNSLVTACNQSSSREPVTSLTPAEVEEALRELSEKYLVTKILGGRAPKFEHDLQHVLALQDSERAVLIVLLLRGQQTAGEIKQRTERLHHFASLDEVEETLSWFIDYPHGPLVERIPIGGGRRVETFAHLLCEHADDVPAPASTAETPVPPAPLTPDPDAGWREDIEAQIAELQQQLADLRGELGQ